MDKDNQSLAAVHQGAPGVTMFKSMRRECEKKIGGLFRAC
jgi:hypothetical protein